MRGGRSYPESEKSVAWPYAPGDMICDIAPRSYGERAPASVPVERRGLVRKLLIMMALTAVVVLVGACDSPETGGSPTKKNPSQNGTPAKAEGPTPLETVQVAYRETAAERTARISYEATTTGPSVGPRGIRGGFLQGRHGKGGRRHGLLRRRVENDDRDARDGQPRDAAGRGDRLCEDAG